MNETIKRTRQLYGDVSLVVNALIPNPFDSKPIQDTINVIGEQQHADLKAKASRLGWSAKRLEIEIRASAEEVHASEQS